MLNFTTLFICNTHSQWLPCHKFLYISLYVTYPSLGHNISTFNCTVSIIVLLCTHRFLIFSTRHLPLVLGILDPCAQTYKIALLTRRKTPLLVLERFWPPWHKFSIYELSAEFVIKFTTKMHHEQVLTFKIFVGSHFPFFDILHNSIISNFNFLLSLGFLKFNLCKWFSPSSFWDPGWAPMLCKAVAILDSFSFLSRVICT